jgi:hypothetical protein
MAGKKINSKNLRARCRAKGITISALAKQINRSRPAVYFAVENPSRYSLTYALVLEALT